MKDDPLLHFVTAPRRNSRHWQPLRLRWSEFCAWFRKPATRKESGNYLAGALLETTVDHDDRPGCTALHRLRNAVAVRSPVLLLDADSLTPAGLAELKAALEDYQAVMHTTFSHTAASPRVRIAVLVDREMDPDEYASAVSALMDRLGRKYFDAGSMQPERYMFKPGTPDPDLYEHWQFDGPVASVAGLLDDFDPATLPPPRLSRRKRDPFELEGVVGAFNRAYPTLDELVDAYELPYERVDEHRWLLVGASSASGMGPVADGVFYSHHASDPAGGLACTAFDVVRLHRFHWMDLEAENTPVNRRPSYGAMKELAAVDPKVVAELVGEDFSALGDNDDSDGDDGDDDGDPPQAWRLSLTISPRTGRMNDEVANWDLIRANDPVFRALYFNEMTFAVEVDADLPWRTLAEGGPQFTAGDRAALMFYLEREYRFRPASALVDQLVALQGTGRRLHPVQEYLESLVWDGTPRVETCLPGVRPDRYTRLVARKVMTAAVARVFEPGIKWDHTLVLYGPEGLGKSYWAERLARGYLSSLGRLGDKDTLITLHRSWIVLADEGFSLRKADAEMQKEFLTRNVDVFRLPYEREATVHPRRSVIWATTNDEVFLRVQEGNRRFLPVHCQDPVDFKTLTPEYIDQLWAEAVALYLSGEQLYLTAEDNELSAAERERYTEEDVLPGIIQEYLDTPVPEAWPSMSPELRAEWMRDRAQGMVPPGTVLQDTVSSMQVWVEALDRRIGDHRRVDLLEITAALKKLPGWSQSARRRVPHYGKQVVFVRDEDLL